MQTKGRSRGSPFKRSVDSTPARDFAPDGVRGLPPTPGFLKPIAGTRQFGEQAEKSALRRYRRTADTNTAANRFTGHHATPSMNGVMTHVRHDAERHGNEVTHAGIIGKVSRGFRDSPIRCDRIWLSSAPQAHVFFMRKNWEWVRMPFT